MLSLPTRADVERTLAGPLPDRLFDLLTASHLAAVESGVADLTHYLVVQPGDTEADIVREVGFSPLVNPIDGIRFGAADFQPWWDWLSDRGGWFDIVVAVGNDGFAFYLFVECAGNMATDLVNLCRLYAE